MFLKGNFFSLSFSSDFTTSFVVPEVTGRSPWHQWGFYWDYIDKDR